MKISITLAIALGFQLTAASVALADGPISGAELRKVVPGHYHMELAPGVTLEVTLVVGGSVAGVTNKGDHDKGRWHVVGDKVCVLFGRWLDHKEHCSALNYANGQIKGDGFYAKRK